VLGLWLDLTLKVFSNLNESIILLILASQSASRSQYTKSITHTYTKKLLITLTVIIRYKTEFTYLPDEFLYSYTSRMSSYHSSTARTVNYLALISQLLC